MPNPVPRSRPHGRVRQPILHQFRKIPFRRRASLLAFDRPVHDVSIANLELLTKILSSEAGHHSEFEFSVGELGAYPSIRRPRVVWVGVEAPPELHALQRGIETETTRLGYAREDRKFSPHLTLGRVSRGANSSAVRQISEVLSNCKVGYLGAARVRAANLYRSDLKPSGAVYTELFSAPLGGSDS